MSSNEWATYKLEQVLEVKYGKDHKALVAGDVPVYGSGGIMRYADKALYRETSILIPRKGTLNNLFFLDNPFWTVDTMFYTILNREIIDPKFLFYKLKMFNYSEMNVGTAVPSMTVQVLNELQITIPNKRKQEKISFILSTIDQKIENNIKTNNTLEEIARTLFKEWFVNCNYPKADDNLDNSELGGIPERWKIGNFEDIAEQVKESINPSICPDKEFLHYSLPAFDIDELPNTDLGSSILSNKTKVKKYSVLFSKLNPRIPRIWPIGDIDEELSICSTEFIGFKPKKDFFYSYINIFFKQPELMTKLTGIATGTSNSHQRIKPSDLLELSVLIPDDDIVRKFDKIVKPILEIRFHKLLENQQLKKTRDTLLPKLMSGEIELNG